MKLADLQAAFQDAILREPTTILAHIPDGARERKEALLDVYREGYVLRLRDILRDDFARMRTYLGDDMFDDLARRYIALHPSHSFNARDTSRVFPEFVAASELAQVSPHAVGIARLEGLLGDIFDIADAPTLDLSDLAPYAPEDFARLRFAPHPSVRRLRTPAGVEAAFTALSQGLDPPPPGPGAHSAEEEQLIVWRRDVVPHYRALSDEEAMLWDELTAGTPFGALCELAATYDDPETAPVRVATYLQGWLQQGLLHAVDLRG